MRLIILLILLHIFAVGCYLPIKGRVVDSDTSRPIAGAVVLAQWTKTHGIGDISHTTYKIIETETDSEGNFSLSGVSSPTVDPPRLVIIKRGYIAWRNDIVFPSFNKRLDYSIWERSYEYKLERFTSNLSHYQHYLFLGHGIIGSSVNATPRFSQVEMEEHDLSGIE